MEDLLDLLHEGGLAATADVIDLLIRSADAVAALTAGEADPQPLNRIHLRFDELFGSATNIGVAEPSPSAGRAAPPTGERFLRVPVERLDALVKLVGELVVQRGGFEQRL